jgi:hypothetical protein
VSDTKLLAPAGSASVPVRFGDQVITSLLFNHDANPVHHKPDHAVQWMLGLFAGSTGLGVTEALAGAGPEERTYALGAELLRQQDIVVMPGVILAAIAFERFVQPDELTASMTATFTYPLLVPTKDAVEVRLEATEQQGPLPGKERLGPARRLVIEAHAPGIEGARVRLMKLEVLVFPARADAEAVVREVVAPEFDRLRALTEKKPGLPALSHPASISEEDGRRYAHIVGLARPITPAAWQAKIPRVLTEVTDLFRRNEAYQTEVKAYYANREDEAERHRAIERYVRKEVKYGHLAEADVAARVEELAAIPQLLYARQHTVFDPRLFAGGGPASVPGTRINLDLSLHEIRLRRGIHRFFTGGRLGERQVFMGEAMVTGQPLVTKELANFLCEINHSFETLRLFEYRRGRQA